MIHLSMIETSIDADEMHMAKIPKSLCKSFEKCSNTSKESHAHFQCDYNKCEKFEECQSRGVRRVDYTK
jgi:hypothetical protein